MSSYMTYRITTKTSLAMFKKNEFYVNRRFSDFLGLHNKLVHKHLQLGVIIPIPPEKDSLSMAKVKISKEEGIPSDFIDRRRSQLERYLNRLARHEKLIQDPDFREFIEMPSDLPKSTNTQALSGAGVLRVFSNITNQVTKLTTKTSEQDQWFEEKHSFILDLHTHFKQLFNHFSTLFTQRKEAGLTLKHLSTSLNHLATIEEHTLLSSALIELANVEEKIEQINIDHTLKEYTIISELIKEYISLLEMVQLAFQERMKIHQQWLTAEDTLRKKRETKTKLEQTPKGADKLPQAEMEINDWEGKVVRGKEDFERISTSIKQELEVFEQTRIEDFKIAIDNYLKQLLEQQEKILEIWEAYLPEANKINV
jgi:sorting nexin-1/2